MVHISIDRDGTLHKVEASNALEIKKDSKFTKSKAWRGTQRKSKA
jgi:hypothetical protein